MALGRMAWSCGPLIRPAARRGSLNWGVDSCDSSQRWERIAVDMMDKASALPTYPQRQQQKQPTDFTIGLKASTRPHDEELLFCAARNFVRSSELFIRKTNGESSWDLEEAHYCGYWVSPSQSLSCLLFLCITNCKRLGEGGLPSRLSLFLYREPDQLCRAPPATRIAHLFRPAIVSKTLPRRASSRTATSSRCPCRTARPTSAPLPMRKRSI